MQENKHLHAAIDFNAPSVQSHLTILQAVITRMASNSASCKAWCITLTSAILVVVADKSKPDYAFIAMIPISLFFFLDAHYLALERLFRDKYNCFIRRLHEGKATIDDVFVVGTETGLWGTLWATAKAAFSISVLPFYGVLYVMVEIARRLIFAHGGSIGTP